VIRKKAVVALLLLGVATLAACYDSEHVPDPKDTA
jgi:hypothetical protein